MDFFEHQEAARRSTRWLLLWYTLAMVFVVASFCAAAAAIHAAVAAYAGTPVWAPLQVYAVVGGLVAGIIVTASGYRIWQLSEGGPAIAHLLGARYLDPARCTGIERRLLNVIEEMAIASGIVVPPAYVLDSDDAINALVAGYSPNEAVIIVTKGALEKLSRDELQGVMGHEYSHILNGDMALNVRLAGILAGLTWIGETGEAMVYRAAWQAKGVAREEQGAGAVAALAGGLAAFIGFPGAVAASAIKAAISRQREFLADAASVQFTRNPEGISGALDSILALRAHTRVRALHAEQLSHMFFAQAVGHSWGFPTHPPIEERIRRAHPRFLRDEYRATRHGRRSEVAVLDGSGNVVRNVRSGRPDAAGAAAAGASIGRPTAEHVDYSARLLAHLPQRLREALQLAEEAELAMLALALDPNEVPRRTALEVIEARRGELDAAKARDLHAYVRSLTRNYMLTLVELAVPAIKAQRQKKRDRFLADLGAVVEADQRVTLRELVLLTLLKQRLREGAGEPIPTRYRALKDVAEDVRVVLSVVALAALEGVQPAFEKGARVLKFDWHSPLGVESLTAVRIGESLERLRHLTPFAKPALLKACFETAAADGVLRLAEAELVRMVAATLDCPVPPLLAAQDPLMLAA